MSEHRPRLFVECSATYYRELNTGIQRVVRNIVERGPAIAERHGVEIVPVVVEYGQFWRSGKFSALKKASTRKTSFIRLGTGLSARLANRQNRINERAASWPVLTILVSMISLARRMIRSGGALILRLKFLGDVLKGRVRRIRPQSGDILLMADAFWGYNSVPPLKKARYAPLCVISLIYDLIPITHPEYCAADFVDGFSGALPGLSARSQGFITISNAIQTVLKDYLQEAVDAGATRKPIATWYLGADIFKEPPTMDDRTGQPPPIAQRHRMERTFLMVGTMDPRKGYELVFEAMSSLWDEGFDYELLIVGRIGWQCEPLLERMKQSPHYGRRLGVYADVSDSDLQYLYQNVAALIFASNAEGFGLPLVESLQQGLPVIASDIPVFREIGGRYPSYFRHGDAEDLAKVLKAFAASPKQRVEDFSWRSWSEAIEELIPLCLSIQQDAQRNLN